MSTQSNGISWQVISALLLAGVAGSACGSDGPSILRIRTEASPLLLVHRDEGAAEWSSVPVAGKTEFELEVADLYELVIVCEYMRRDLQIVARRYARTDDDGAELSGLCPYRPFVVSGMMVQSGAVAFGSALTISASASRQIALPAKAGTNDLFMFGSTGFVLETVGARRGVEVTGDLDLGVLDFSQEVMQPLVRKTFAASNALPEEELTTLPWFINDKNDFPILGASDDATAHLLPEVALLGSERQVVEVTATDDPPRDGLFSSRTFIAEPTQASPVTLPERIGEPSVTHQLPRSLITWKTLPDYDRLVFTRLSSSAEGVDLRHELGMSRSYAEATGAAQLELELDFQEIPGFLPEWQPATNVDPGIFFTAEKGTRTEAGSTFSSANRAFIQIIPAEHQL